MMISSMSSHLLLCESSVHGRLGNLLVTRIKLLLDSLWDLLEQVLREDAEQLPSDVQRGEDVAVLIRALVQEALLKLVRELKVQMLLVAECLFTDHRLHCARVLANGVVCVQLVRHVRVVHPGHTL